MSPVRLESRPKHSTTESLRSFLGSVYFAYVLLLFSITSYTMGCPTVREDNPRALASGLSYVQADNP